MKLLIDNHDGLGLQDYSASFDPEHLPAIQRKLNQAAAMQACLVACDSAFRAPASGARVVLQRDDGYKLFTGYLTSAPQQEFLGSTQTGAVWRYALAASDDSWLLAHNAPTARVPFVYRTAGDALRTISNDVLPGVLDESGIQDLGYVNQYEPSSQRLWSEHARELATMERACFRVHDGRITFEPVGQQGLTIDEQDPKFSPNGLTLAQPDQLCNDATIVGELEPTTYVRDYFIGDGTTLGFYLSRTPFARTTVTVFEEEYTGPGLSPILWYVTDPSAKVSVTGGQLNLNGGPVTVGLLEVVELAGGLRFQHGQVTFTASSSGTLGGIYNGAVADSNCFAGFRITPSGGNSAIQGLINGVGSGTRGWPARWRTAVSATSQVRESCTSIRRIRHSRTNKL